ncbi:UNVERIFIED_CONTAM: putative protein ABIL5 [Sesamum latifolium]|uniref:Protein ABIL5 n=1 Tax=Sesamum latifolium TaxID=2727402 RepID=A0AAW2VBC2_9LAMI
MEKMRRIEEEDSNSSNITLVDNAKVLEKSVQELRDFSSQVYRAADHCESSFLNTQDKRIVLETTKEYISRAVVTVVDHLGGISANLEYSLRNSDSIPQTEHKIDMLKLRIGTCQQQFHKLALERFYLTADFSRHHCRYILPPSKDSGTKNVESRCAKGDVQADEEKRNEFETEEPLFLHTYNCKPSLQVENSKTDMVKSNEFSSPVLPVNDRLAILPKAEQSTFQFQSFPCRIVQNCRNKSCVFCKFSIFILYLSRNPIMYLPILSDEGHGDGHDCHQLIWWHHSETIWFVMLSNLFPSERSTTPLSSPYTPTDEVTKQPELARNHVIEEPDTA